MKALVIADHDNVSLKATTLHIVAAAQKVGAQVDMLVVGHDCDAVVAAAAQVQGVTRVLSVKGEAFASQSSEVMAAAVVAAQAQGEYTHIFAVSAHIGKAGLPRASALLDADCLSDVVDVIAADTFKRFIYAGNVLATVKTSAALVIATVRCPAFAAVDATGGNADVVDVACEAPARRFEFVSLHQVKSDRPDLLTAKRVVAGGRGLHDEAGFATMEAFADKIGAAVGSTRAIVDMFIAPNETQVGQTGKVVAPELYFAFGISGAIQHVAGMKDSKVIVAVNKDPEAPIFEMCDYYLEADAIETIKELTAKL
jgi:electron transfer flavoprotein alpha subunit